MSLLVKCVLVLALELILIASAFKSYRKGDTGAAWGYGIAACGSLLSYGWDLLPLIGGPKEHWSYGPMAILGLLAIAFGIWKTSAKRSTTPSNPTPDADP